MKKRFLLLTLIMCLLGGMSSLSLKAQEENVVVGNGSSTSDYAPFCTYNNKSASQSIYLQSEIGKAGVITHLAYKVKKVDYSGSYTRNIKVYVKETSKSDYSSGNAYERMEVADLKYEGTFIYNDNNDEWITIPLSNGQGFEYSGENNLIISIEDNTNSAMNDGGDFIDYTSFYAENLAVVRTIYTRSAIDMTTVSKIGTSEYNRPQIQLTFADQETPGADVMPVTDYEISLDGYSITLEWQFADQNTNKYQVCFGTTEQDIKPWHYPEWQTRKTDAGNLVEDGSFTFEDPSFVSNGKVYFKVNVRKDEGEIIEGKTAFYVIFDEEEPVTWADTDNNANDVFVRANVNVATDITAKNVTIENGGVLTIAGGLKASKLTINDGCQLLGADKLTCKDVNFNMNIVNPDSWSTEHNTTGWQFISSPFTDALISNFVTTGDDNDYDLYKYDGSAENHWVNQKEGNFGETFTSGVGYLASYQAETTATLKGTLNKSTVLDLSSGQLSYHWGGLADIYLIGNPFPFDMEWNKMMVYNIVEGFAVVTAEGGYDYSQTTIPVGDGFLVKTIGTNPALYYKHVTDSKSRNAEQSKSLNIIAAGNAGNDNVVVNFAGEGEGFPKLQNFNDDIATVYVQNNDANYGIYNCDENTTEIELCFNANQMGNYTISVEPTGEFSSIVLVDRFTGIETNLLVDDYHFTAMSDANNNRFIVKLVNGQQTTDDNHFVYQSGEELIIEAEGTVQIIDVMGRMVYSNDVESNSRINVSDFNNGAYIVRVINEEGVRSQKVVIY